MTNMSTSSNIAYQGNRSMRIMLQNQADSSSVAQNNQYGIPDSSIKVCPGLFYSFGGYFKSTGISVPSEHWLEWSSTKTGSDTNNRPILPDPFYYTPHFLAGPTPVDWTYVNRTFQLPAGFPNVELRHRFTIDGIGSGSVYLDNISFRQIPDPAATNWTSLIAFGSSWSYLTNSPPANWFAADFDSTRWPVGTAKFGAGSGPTNIATRLPQFLSNYYFKKQFCLSATNLEELLLSVTCTDVDVLKIYPPRLFLNGQAIPATIDAVTMQGNEVRYFDLVPYVSLLKAGPNTIAVELGNTWSDYDDIAFDLSLKAVVYNPTVTRLTLNYSDPTHPGLTAETAPGTIWQLQSCDILSTNGWQTLQTFTNSTSGTQTFFDTGQNGRPSPTTARSRFYRLVPN